jgi:hypothetical protein
MIAVGLMLGTRLWYAMWDAENDDDAAFERRVDSVVREIGERGKLIAPESVPPVCETAPTPAPAPELAPAPEVAPGPTPTRAPAPAPAMSSTTGPAIAPSPSPTSALVSQQSGTVAITPNVVSSVEQQPMAVHQFSSSANFAASGTGASLMEVSAFMTEQLQGFRQMWVVEQRAQDKDQHTEIMHLLVERDAKLEAQRKEFETRLGAQTQASETKLEAQRKEIEAQRKDFETRLEGQRKEMEAQRVKSEAKLERLRREMQVQARVDKITKLQLRLDVLSESKLLEDEELSTIEDKVADAIGAAPTEDGADRVWDCVMQMVRLSEGIVSEKMFARQLRRKFL